MTVGDDNESSPKIRAILYDAAGHDREIRLEEIDINGLSNEQLLWVDLVGLDQTGLPPQMLKSLGSIDDPGSLEMFGNFYRFCIPLRDRADSCLRFVVAQSWVLTASECRLPLFDKFIEADQGETLKGKMTATAFMAALLMRHLDGFREEIAGFDVAIDKLDDTILRSREKRSPLRSLAALRRKLSALRVVLSQHRRVIHGLIAPDFGAHISESDREYLVEANRLFERLEDDITRARETVIGSFDLYASRVAADTNQLIKVLTIAAVITGVIGAVGGVFGMNFETPIPKWGLAGFLSVVGAMIAVSASIVVLAIWRRWV